MSNELATVKEEALKLFQSGQFQQALMIIEPLARSNPYSVDAHHILALIFKSLGQNSKAEDAFKACLILAPDNAQILNNYANFLNGLGNFKDAKEIFKMMIKSTPHSSAGWLGLGLAALKAGINDEAESAFRKVISMEPTNTTAWHGLGSNLRAQGKLSLAIDAFRRAVDLDPNNAAAWINLGVILRLQGDGKGAAPCFDAAEKAGYTGPEIMDGRASLLLDQGKSDEGIALYREVCKVFPGYVPAHETLARTLYQTKPEVSPNTEIRAAANNQPNNAGLQMGFLKFLSEQRKWEEYLDRIQMLGARIPEPLALFSRAIGLDGLDQLDEARPLFEKSIKLLPNDPNFQTAYIRFLLRDKNPELAAKQGEAFVKHFPKDQMAWGYLGLAWRLLGDEREHWLHGYDSLIQPLKIDIPDAFNSEEEFYQALEKNLLPFHTATKEPVDQSVRTGTQTGLNLFGKPEGNIKYASEAILRAMIEYQRNLPEDETHPFLSRKSDLLRFIGSWSVRLRQSGFHISHLHGEGWLSSAFYVALPPSINEGQSDHQGWIQFGQPQDDLGLTLEPRRLIKPKVGCLAVFPSYTWHGTIPFDDKIHRLTMAYDVVPE